MLSLKRTDSSHPDFESLVCMLDQELELRDGADHDFFKQFNKIDHIKFVVLAYSVNIAVGSGAIKHFSEDTMEVKRMFVINNLRGQGIAGKILEELEIWAKELGYTKVVLETGLRQPEAIRLYEKNGYVLIPNYGQYAGVASSVCFSKVL